MKKSRKLNKEKRAPALKRIRTLDLMMIRHVLYHSATPSALISDSYLKNPPHRGDDDHYEGSLNWLAVRSKRVSEDWITKEEETYDVSIKLKSCHQIFFNQVFEA